MTDQWRNVNDQWHRDVLAYWFGELKPRDWYFSNPDIDAQIRERFLPVMEALRVHVPREAWDSANEALAAVIACDQFPRNVFRGTGDAFAWDPLAFKLATNALDKGLDASRSPAEKRFFYMPFMHAENLKAQQRSLELFASLADGVDSGKYAQSHYDVVARFGRFPTRNRALGRTSTPEEEEFLKNAKRYGQ